VIEPGAFNNFINLMVVSITAKSIRLSDDVFVNCEYLYAIYISKICEELYLHKFFNYTNNQERLTIYLCETNSSMIVYDTIIEYEVDTDTAKESRLRYFESTYYQIVISSNALMSQYTPNIIKSFDFHINLNYPDIDYLLNICNMNKTIIVTNFVELKFNINDNESISFKCKLLADQYKCSAQLNYHTIKIKDIKIACDYLGLICNLLSRYVDNFIEKVHTTEYEAELYALLVLLFEVTNDTCETIHLFFLFIEHSLMSIEVSSDFIRYLYSVNALQDKNAFNDISSKLHNAKLYEHYIELINIKHEFGCYNDEDINPDLIL